LKSADLRAKNQRPTSAVMTKLYQLLHYRA
jgi:hypothetical protein